MSKLNLNREEMPRQTPAERVKNFDEVALGYSDDQAKAEAARCIQCKKPLCIGGCPVEIDIPGFIQSILDSDMLEAVRILKDKNSLPGICGRVCPQETQCEAVCALHKKGASLAIGRLERYVADWERAHMGLAKQKKKSRRNGKKVAVIGSGPAGLVVAADLVKLGYSVTVFEALHTAGGVLVYGIPQFRLPKEIVQAEVDYVASLGVRIELNVVIGKVATIDELLEDGFEAVFLGTGAGAPLFMNIEGENFNGVLSANEFLTRVNLMKAYRFPDYDTPVKIGKKVAVIGGGNVAMDAARCALRLGAGEVSIIYRRSDVEMPARREEVENAREEGVKFKLLTNPKRFLGNQQGWLEAIECYHMELGEPDESGRRRPIVKKGSGFAMDVDMAIVALGTRPNPLVASTTPDLQTDNKGIVITDSATGRTKKPGVWAGVDFSTGAATVIIAMGAARRAARDIDEFLKSS